MAIDERYFLSPPITQVFMDKDTGEPLAGGTLTFYEDGNRVAPKSVYELTGNPGSYVYTALPNPVTLSSTGQPMNASNVNTAIYFLPFDADDNIELYYIECKNASGDPQFTRESYPNVTSGNDPTDDPFPVTNQIANPQFAKVFLNDTETIEYVVSAASNEVFKFAPDWDIIISGTGTVTVARETIPGNDNVITSPPYSARITVPANITKCHLRQRFNANSGLWASTTLDPIFLSGSLVGLENTAASSGISMWYEESTGGSAVQVFTDILTANYERVAGSSIAIPESTNTGTGEDSYVDIYLDIPTGGDVSLTSIQVVPTHAATGIDNLNYDNNSSNREFALLGSYYLPNLEYKPIPSFLVGWDFPLNPAQFGGASQSMINTAAYIWDQTIGYVTTTTNTIVRSAITGAFQITTGGAAEACYLLQYLDGEQVHDMLGEKLSVNVNAWKTAAGDDVTVRVYLYRGSSAASFPDLTMGDTIGTLAATGIFTLTEANWTLIERGGLDTATATLKEIAVNSDINDGVDYRFNNWQIIDDTEIGDTDKFAIVVTFVYPSAASIIEVQSVSVVPGDIATRPAVKTLSQTLEDCRYYYEASYEVGTATGTATSVGEQSKPMLVPTPFTDIYLANFEIVYKTPKRSSSSVMSFWDPAGTADKYQAAMSLLQVYPASTGGGTNPQPDVISRYDIRVQSTDNVIYWPNTTGYTVAYSVSGNDHNVGRLLFHYEADARLGIV